MIWQSEGGGPWGSGPRGGGNGGSGSPSGGTPPGGGPGGGSQGGGGGRGPWGGGRGGGSGPGGRRPGGPGPGGSGGGARPPYPPNLEDILRRSQDRFRRLLPGGIGSGTGIAVVVLALVAIWLASGFYRVLPDEVGVVLRFGAYNRTTQPGLNYHLPAPIESVLTPSVTRVNRTEIGYRSADRRSGAPRQLPEEALMLTGDENIVDINFTVFWAVKNAQDYLFNIRDPDRTVKSAAESAMREVIGETPIASALAEGRGKIESETQKLLQHLLDYYNAGIEITQVQLQRVDPPDPVIDAFRDVQRALADRARLRNEAEAYRNDILPRARGQAVSIVQEAEAYQQKTINQAEGDGARFDAVYQAFKASKDVTRQRLYIETMEDILKNSKKVIIDKGAAGSSGVLPYLPLPGLLGTPHRNGAKSGAGPNAAVAPDQESVTSAPPGGAIGGAGGRP